METFHQFCDEKRSKIFGPILSTINPIPRWHNSTPNASVLYCVVCGDRSSGRHYGAISCEGCKSFFWRSMLKQSVYKCKKAMDCEVTKEQRLQCSFCRLQKCISVGMFFSESVQSKRKKSTDSASATGKSLVSTSFETLSPDDEEEDSILYELEGSLLTDENVSFHLETTVSSDAHLSAQYISESASRLLFLSVHWARSISAFQLLSSDTQIELVRGCWTELFALGLAQCSDSISLPAILTAILTQLRAESKVSVQRIKSVTELVMKIHDYVTTMSKLEVDEHEYAYLKAIALFNPDHAGSTSRRQVEHFQERVSKELRSYVSQTWNNEDRFPRLLLRLSPIRSLPSDLVEELFFGALIGQVHIDSVIPFILAMDQTNNNGEGDPAEKCLTTEISV